MAEERAEAGGERRVGAIMHCGEYGGRPLEHVTEQGGYGESLAAGPQHVGRADIAGTDRAQIGAAGRAREQHAERYGAQQIAKCEGEREDHTYS